MNIVEINNVSNFSLHEINANVPKGEMVGLVGPDGSGKTTLLRLIAGLLKPSTGTITINGFDTIKDATEIHKIIGYMPQKFGLYEDLTVEQNLNLYADLRELPQSEKQKTFEKLLHFTGLEPFTQRISSALSGGMKQKLGLACALIKKPTLLLLDEPSVGVDPISRRELWKMVSELVQEGISVIWSTSYLDEAEKCPQVLLLNEGKLLFQGKPQSLNPNIEKFEDAFMELLGGGEKKESPLGTSMPMLKKTDRVMIDATNLTKRFGNFTAASDINLKVPQGEIFGLLGPNGAGKTTTFKMLCGLLKPNEGSALVNGVDLQKAPGEARAHIGYMAQKFSLYGNLSVKQNLDFFSGAYNLSGKTRKNAIDQMINIFNLQPYLNENADLLPLGFKQRLALSCSLMHHPSILFLDEPTAGVDPITRQEFWGHIYSLVDKGMTVMVTTHFMDEAEFCDRIGLVYKSKLIKVGTPQELKEAMGTETLEEAFIQLIEHYDESKTS